MNLKEEAGAVFRKIKECEDRGALINDYLSQIKKRASHILSCAEKIVLVGATPFAKNTINNKTEIFRGKDVVLADKFDEIGKSGGWRTSSVQGRMLKNMLVG